MPARIGHARFLHRGFFGSAQFGDGIGSLKLAFGSR